MDYDQVFVVLLLFIAWNHAGLGHRSMTTLFLTIAIYQGYFL